MSSPLDDLASTVRRRAVAGADKDEDAEKEVDQNDLNEEVLVHKPLARQESNEMAYLSCALDYNPDEIECENDREMFKSVSICGLMFIILSGTDLAVNFLVFESQTNADGNFYTGHSYSFDTEKQMMLASVARCVFTVIFILFVSIDGIYSQYPDVIRYVLGSVYYVFYCHILVCVLIDSERSDFEYDFMYWCCLFLNVVWTTGHVLLALLIWKAWAKRAYRNLGTEKDVTVEDKEAKLQSSPKIPLTDKEIAKGRRNKKKEALEDTAYERTLPMTVLVRKLLGWYKSELLGIILGHVLLSAIATAESLTPYYEAKTLDVIAGSFDLRNLYYPLMMHAIVSVVEKILSAIRNVVSARVSGRLSVQVRSQLFNNILKQEIGFFDKTRSGEITDRLSSFSDELSSVLKDLETIVTTIVRLITLMSVMLKMSWRLTLVLLMCNILLMLPSHLQIKFKKALNRKMERVRVGAGNIGQEAIQCIRTVRTFANEDEEVSRYTEKLQERYKMKRDEDLLDPTMATLNEGLWIGARALTLCYGAHLISAGHMSTGELISFLVYMRKLFNQFSKLLNWQLSRFIGKFGRVERLLEYLERKPAMMLDGPLAPDTLRGSIEFKNVSFSYPARPETVVLKDVSFTVKPGEVVALVGPSGAGKSSCIQLLQRFYDPTQGQVLLDDVPLDQYQHKYLHKLMAMVSQEPVLFARSIYDNIVYGEKGLDKDEVVQAARDANAHSFIEELSKKYNTDAGEFGKQLSGGQKQRIAIARAVVRNPKILLLDEATSALDAESEALVQEALEKSMAGRTVVVIAHRLSTVARAHRVVVLDQGQVVEQGPPEQLYKQRGLYYRLVKKQMILRQDSGEMPPVLIQQMDDSFNNADSDMEMELRQRNPGDLNIDDDSSALEDY